MPVFETVYQLTYMSFMYVKSGVDVNLEFYISPSFSERKCIIL